MSKLRQDGPRGPLPPAASHSPPVFGASGGRGTPRLSRRRFLKAAGAGGVGALIGLAGGAGRGLAFQPDGVGSGTSGVRSPEGWNPLRMAPEVKPNALTLHAEVGRADVGGGMEGDAWLLNGSLPSPLIRVRKGERFHAILENDVPDPLILHWHGLTPPADMDGHPRYAVREGETYEYDFTVENRAGTYWYHSHAHHRVGKHAYLGIAGMLIVEDEEEEGLGLPSGEREIPIVLQDRRVDPERGLLHYSNPDTVEGVIGNEPFGNGVNYPYLEVDTAVYRFRILNGSNARIFRLAREDGRPMTLIGNDAGLLPRSEDVEYVDMGPGERVDLLLDLRDASVGEVIQLGSRAFHIGTGLAGEQQTHRQGHPLELLKLVVAREVEDSFEMPGTLADPGGPDPADAVRERTFTFTSDRDYHTRTMMEHHINDLSYRMDRIDERVPFGETEIWSFINENHFPHPMHLHATHFRVLSREGYRGLVLPWERGLKDTVLVHPEEHVRVAVRFDAHPGLFLLHCHNLEHEDVGMMLNIMVER